MKYAKSVWDTKITGIKKSKTKKAKKKKHDLTCKYKYNFLMWLSFYRLNF